MKLRFTPAWSLNSPDRPLEFQMLMNDSPRGVRRNPPTPVVNASQGSASHPRLRSEELFGNGVHEVIIEHGNDCYRLRLTRQGKLLLHK